MQQYEELQEDLQEQAFGHCGLRCTVIVRRCARARDHLPNWVRAEWFGDGAGAGQELRSENVFEEVNGTNSGPQG